MCDLATDAPCTEATALTTEVQRLAAEVERLRAEVVKAWDEGAKALMRAASEEQTISFIAPHNPYRALLADPDPTRRCRCTYTPGKGRDDSACEMHRMGEG